MSTKTLLISESAAATMRRAAAAAYPDETGGILLGVRSGNTPWVVRAEEFVESTRGRNHFQIEAGATSAAVQRAQSDDIRLGYLGDWHSHPADIGPSRMDLWTLRRYSTVGPGGLATTLIVVRRQNHRWVLDSRRILRCRTVTCLIQLSGDLLPTRATLPGEIDE